MSTSKHLNMFFIFDWDNIL